MTKVLLDPGDCWLTWEPFGGQRLGPDYTVVAVLAANLSFLPVPLHLSCAELQSEALTEWAVVMPNL